MTLDIVKEKSTFLFDFDGTLFHLFTGYDFKSVSQKLYKRLLELGITFPTSINPFEVFAHIKTDAKSKEAYDLANSYAADALKEIELDAAKNTGTWVKGALECLKYLYDNGYKVAIASNNSEECIKLIMERDLKGYNIPYIGRHRNHIEWLKPSSYMLEYLLNKVDSTKDDAIFFGDHPRDLVCANNLGCSFLGVTPTKEKKERMLSVISEDLTMDDLFVLLNKLQ